jgi:KilA-N domain
MSAFSAVGYVNYQDVKISVALEDTIVSCHKVFQGYVNISAMLRKQSRELNEFFSLESTDEFMHRLYAEEFEDYPSKGNDMLKKTSAPKGYAKKNASYFVAVITTGSNCNRGTWMHPKLAIHFASWISHDFHFWMWELMGKLIKTGTVKLIDDEQSTVIKIPVISDPLPVAPKVKSGRKVVRIKALQASFAMYQALGDTESMARIAKMTEEIL